VAIPEDRNIKENEAENKQKYKSLFILQRFTAKKVCTACSRTSYRIVPLTILNKNLHNDTSETEVSINECK
jgi:hypothetical protein